MVGAAHADDWNGFYVGVNTGLSFDNFGMHTTTVFSPTGYFVPSSVPAINAVGVQPVKTTGFMLGLDGGYNMQFGDLVVGIDGDFAVNSANGSALGSAIYPCCAPTGFTVSTSSHSDWGLTFRPRVGWLMGDVLFYGTGGLAAQELRFREDFTDNDNAAVESATSNGVRLGWTVGAGVEVPIGPGWTLKGEYLHTDLGTLSVSSTNFADSGGPFPTTVFTASDHVRMDTFKLGLNLHL